MDEAGTRSYPNVLAYVSRTPWAITGEALGVVKDVIQARLAGWRPTAEESATLEQFAASRPGAVRAGSVAVIPLQGMLVPRASLFSAMSGGTSMEAFCQMLQGAVDDPGVAHIVIDIDSPGGVSDMIPETAAVIRAATDVKPVTAVANSQAGSAAYWLGSQATEFSVTRSGSVGSIGVLGIHTDVSQALAVAGVKKTIIKSAVSPHKAELNSWEPLSNEARAYAQTEIDETAELFVQDVAVGRGVDPDYVAANFGQGRMLSAPAALQAGMVDRIETLGQAVDRILGRPAGSRSTFATDLGSQGEPTPVLVEGAETLLSRPGFREAYSTGR